MKVIKAFEKCGFSGIGFHLFRLHKGCWDKVSQVPLPAGLALISASDAVWDLAQIISCSALFIPAVEGRPCAGLVFGDWGDTLHKCQVVMSCESELQNYLNCVPLSLCAQDFELNPCLKAETRSSAALPLPAKARYAEKVALLCFFP